MQDRTEGAGPIRSEVKTKQAGPPRLTLWVLIGSLILAVAVGAMMLSNTEEAPPSAPTAVENAPTTGTPPSAPGAAETAPATGTPPAVPPAEPRTNQ